MPLTTSSPELDKGDTMLGKLVFIALVALGAAEKVTFENYKVLQVIPSSVEQLEVLKQLEELNKGYSFWNAPSRVFQPVDVMVDPGQLSNFAELMSNLDMKYENYVLDVQQLIDKENPLTREAGFGWKRYHTLDEIYQWMDSLAAVYPDKVQVVVGGNTSQGRQIKGVKLSFGQDKPSVFIEGGIHAREWISTATVTYLLNEFLTSEDPEIRKLAEANDWYMFPSFNPDGYVYTHTTNRLWRKTMSNSSLTCKGVDANRNWGYKWMEGGASNDPCTEIYAGKAPFSEPETKSMSKYIKSVPRLFAYITFHSYAQFLLFPYGHTKRHLDNYKESYAIGLKTITALAKRYGTKYIQGNIAETIYIATGSSMDWVKATCKVPVSFSYELRDTGRYGFILPADQIIPNGQEVMDSLVAMFKEAAKFGYPKPLKA